MRTPEPGHEGTSVFDFIVLYEIGNACVPMVGGAPCLPSLNLWRESGGSFAPALYKICRHVGIDAHHLSACPKAIVSVGMISLHDLLVYVY